jgi:uncharacterized protein involved in response to NO
MRMDLRMHDLPRSPQPPQASARLALWNLGFRPFYLVAALFAALSVPLWAMQVAGWIPFAYVASAHAHASEMIFGYTLAVFAGFLFTAARNWTGLPTPHGGTLAALVALWLAGRVLAVTPYAVAAAVVDVAFPLAVAAGIAVPLVRSGNRRNYFFVGLLCVLAAIVLVVHLSGLELVPWPEHAALQVGLDVLLFVMAVMGGRVIPMFTQNGVPGTKPRRWRALERVSLAGLLLLVFADVLHAPPAAIGVLCVLLFLAHAARLAGWQPWRTLRTPLVWILHAAYAWIVLHFLLRALAAAGLVPESLALHALTVGGIGGLTLGMMTRTARGHTGRPLEAGRAEIAMFALITAAAALRVLGVLAVPQAYVEWIAGSAACWSAAFACYFVAYAPYLIRPRMDGKPG